MKNYEEKPEKLTIGLILEDVFSEFAKEVIHGVLACVKRDEQVHLVVLAGRQLMNNDPDPKQDMHRKIYNTIYLLGEVCHFDGLIFALPNMGEEETDYFGHSYFSDYSEIPKVCIASNTQTETTVNYDNVTGIRDAVDYLINTRNVTHFAMLGGREENPDAMNRLQIFQDCLAANRLTFTEEMYEPTDMSGDSVAEAERLLDRNPGVQAIFCVNDPVASALYTAMNRRRLVPGRDIYVFGFDNTRMCSNLVPSLASIGPDEGTLGKCAYDALMAKINEINVPNIVIPTRLFGRESCPYEKYEYSLRELKHAEPAVVYRMFDDCFYRYKNEYIDSRAINLKRLFYEIVYRMLISLKKRYMSNEEFEEICHLIDVFFDEESLSYTDSQKLLKCIDRLQGAVTKLSKGTSSDIKSNLLFARMKDRIIQAQAGQHTRRNSRINSGRGGMKEFLLKTVDYRMDSAEASLDVVIRNLHHLGLPNVALFLFETPVEYNFDGATILPDTIDLRCVLKGDELYIPDPDRRRCSVSGIFEKKELPSKIRSYIPLPLFYGPRLYGYFLCDLSGEITDRGEYFSQILSRAIYLNDPTVFRTTGEIYKAQEIRQKEERQAVFHQIAEGLASHYDIIYYVNSQTGQFREYIKNDIFDSLSLRLEGGDFFEECSANIIVSIHPEDRARIAQIMTRDQLITALENHKQLQADYRMIVNNVPKYTRLTVMWGSNKANFIIGVENIDEEVRREKEQLQALNRANELARRDGLTGAKNITAYHEIEADLQSRIDEKLPDLKFALVVCDINNLKLVNDSLGHQAGDEYIRSACKLIFVTFDHSPVYRLGGDEFAVVLMGSDYEDRESLMEKIRSRVIQNAKADEGPVLAAGLAVFDPSTDEHVTDIFNRADKDMYRNKEEIKQIEKDGRK